MYRIEWIWAGFPIGAVTLLMLPVVGPLVALLAVLAVLAVLVGIVFTLVKAVVATPFLIARAVRRHRQSERALRAETASTPVSRPSLLSPAGPHTAAPRSV